MVIFKSKQIFEKDKKICFVTEGLVSPLDGASLRLYYEYINYFVKKNYDVLYIYFINYL